MWKTLDRGDLTANESIEMESLLGYKCFSQNKPQEDSMNQFIQKYRKKVIGVLSGVRRQKVSDTCSHFLSDTFSFTIPA
ncbi:hypothetical protein ES708_23802 [subsurface metagenome]